MANKDYEIYTAQKEIHPKLLEALLRHKNTVWERPIPPVQKAVFEKANAFVQAQAKPIVLDAGCGRGESSYHLAKHFRNHLVIGIDKSELRLEASKLYTESNCLFLRANLVDFWYQAYLARWPVTHQFILYPNPWPKKDALKHRWQGHSIFPYILKLGTYIELRSNWKLYLQEWQLAATHCDAEWTGEVKPLLPRKDAMTAFERKYWNAGVDTYQLVLRR